MSQLLSGNVSRKITNEFRAGLKVVLSKKITDQDLVDETYEAIIQSLAPSTQGGQRATGKSLHFHNDLLQARYISIIATRPFEAYDQILNEEEKALINIFKKDLIEAIKQKQRPQRVYRFNFPMMSHCELLWKNLEKILQKEAEKYGLQTSLIGDFLGFLYNSKIIRTFYVSDPIFSLPMVAINPDGSSTARLYTVIENDNKGVVFIKIPREDMYPWKTFVWERIKVTQNAFDIPPNLFRSLKSTDE